MIPNRFALLGLALALLPGPALAKTYKLGALQIDDAWSRATPLTAPSGAGFLTVKNTGTTPDRLAGASCPSVAGQTQIHEMKMEGTVMRMRELDQGLAIPAGSTVSLAPGGFHLMMMGLKAPLEKGGKIACTLTFEKAGSLEVEFDVQPLGATHN